MLVRQEKYCAHRLHRDAPVDGLLTERLQPIQQVPNRENIERGRKGDRKGENGKLGKTSRIDQVTQAMHSGGDTRKQSHGDIGVPREDGGELVSAVRTGGRALTNAEEA